ncbi:MAG: PA2778 family cysteine peptidase [Alphaproteobacteria bacterium]
MPVGRPATLVLALTALALAACTTPQSSALINAPGALPLQAEVTEVPFFPQEEFYCGPAALATVLVWSGVAADPEALAARVYTPGRHGTLQNDILAGARREGRLAVAVSSLRDLMTEIAAGHPVLVFENLAFAWYPQWHYAVVVAYDLERREITLRSGRDARRVTALSTFERTWGRGDDWALVVLEPHDLPPTGSAKTIADAAAGLERAGRAREAGVTYAAMLTRWPDSYVALMGLGNVGYATGDLNAAETAFRRAIAARPERAEAWNNLAYVLAADGRREEAVSAAQKAIDLAPGEDRPYRDTLREISEI